jgi:hypothetical protein
MNLGSENCQTGVSHVYGPAPYALWSIWKQLSDLQHLFLWALSAFCICSTFLADPYLMQGRQSVFGRFQFFLGSGGIPHLEAVGGSVIWMFETMPDVQT